jgi:hypothetical protein
VCRSWVRPSWVSAVVFPVPDAPDTISPRRAETWSRCSCTNSRAVLVGLSQLARCRKAAGNGAQAVAAALKLRQPFALVLGPPPALVCTLQGLPVAFATLTRAVLVPVYEA